jgi:hypothetical protein
MAKDKHTVEMAQRPKCQFCPNPAQYDGRTGMGPWAYMCDLHFQMHGLGTGLGVGQRIVVKKEVHK